MIKNNLLFEFKRELQFWQAQKLKLYALILGFVFVSNLAASLLHLGQVLFHTNPLWMKQNIQVYTLARQQPEGWLSGINRTTLQALQKIPSVEQVSWVVPKKETFQVDNSIEKSLDVLFYKPDFFEHFTHFQLNTGSTGVWVSENFAKQNKLIPQRSFLYHARIEQPILVQGILPARFNQMGIWQPDIFLAEHYLRYLTPFSQESSPTLIDNFLASAPSYFGIFQTDLRLDLQEINHLLQQEDLQSTGMKFVSNGSELQIFKGFNLDPVAKNSLLQQWLLLLFFVLGLGLALTFNTFMTYTNRAILRASEQRIEQVLGVSKIYLISAACFSASIKIIIISLLSALVMGLASQFFILGDFYQSITGQINLQFSLTHWLAACCFVAIVFLLAENLPHLKQTARTLFSRQMGTGKNRKQKLATLAGLVTQFVFALIAMQLIGSAIWGQVKLNQPNALRPELATFSVAQTRSTPLRQLQENLAQRMNQKAVAYSVLPFTNADQVMVKNSAWLGEIAFDIQVVSPNYFEVLLAQPPKLSEPWQRGIIINEAAAKRLQLPYQLGAPQHNTGVLLDLGVFYKGQQEVIAVVKNLPHQGKAATPKPTLYFLAQEQPLMNSKALTFYYPNNPTSHLPQALTQLIQENMTFPKITPSELLADVIHQKDKAYRTILIGGFIVASILLMLVLFGFYYHTKAAFSSEQRSYAIFSALGIPKLSIFLTALQTLWLALLVAIPIAVLFLFWCEQKLTDSYLFIVEYSLISFSILTAVLLLLIAGYLPFRDFYKKSIFTYLRN